MEDLTPPIDVGGGDPSAAAEALAGRDVAIHWSNRQGAPAGDMDGYASSAFAQIPVVQRPLRRIPKLRLNESGRVRGTQ